MTKVICVLDLTHYSTQELLRFREQRLLTKAELECELSRRGFTPEQILFKVRGYS